MPATRPRTETEALCPEPIVADASRDAEARRELQGRARRRTGKVPPDLIVDHILAVTEGAPWAVRSEALDAVLRRCEALGESELSIRAKPAGGRITGGFVVESGRGSGRHYEVVLRGLVPLVASCGCADFLRNSLGLCKHVLHVLGGVASSEQRFSAALAATASATEVVAAAVSDPAKPHLGWDPVRPLAGAGPFFERFFVERVTARAARVAISGFGPDETGRLVPVKTAWNDPASRLRLVVDLLALASHGKLTADPAALALLGHERARLEHREPVAPAALRRHLRGLKRRLSGKSTTSSRRRSRNSSRRRRAVR